eukprot:1443513-Prymnesium_polylepis.1
MRHGRCVACFGGLGLGVAVDRRAARPGCPTWGVGHRPVRCGGQPAPDRLEGTFHAHTCPFSAPASRGKFQ